jgi:FkbM family methyltransferase
VFLVGENCLTVLTHDKGVSVELAVHGTHEPRASQLLATFLQPGMTVVDIGSNIGYFALLAARCVQPDGCVIAIEPVPQNAALCRQNLAVNACTRVQFKQVAISDCNDLLPLHLSDKSNWHSLYSSAPSGSSIPVKTATLDAVVEELSPEAVDLIRMDLEGYEITVIHGMRETIKNYSPRLLIELHPAIVGQKALTEYLCELKSLGYEPEWLLDQERDIPLRWRCLTPEKITMAQLASDWRINSHPRSLHVMFARTSANQSHVSHEHSEPSSIYC